jgi:hypothetical protein
MTAPRTPLLVQFWADREDNRPAWEDDCRSGVRGNDCRIKGLQPIWEDREDREDVCNIHTCARDVVEGAGVCGLICVSLHENHFLTRRLKTSSLSSLSSLTHSQAIEKSTNHRAAKIGIILPYRMFILPILPTRNGQKLQAGFNLTQTTTSCKSRGRA